MIGSLCTSIALQWPTMVQFYAEHSVDADLKAFLNLADWNQSYGKYRQKLNSQINQILRDLFHV